MAINPNETHSNDGAKLSGSRYATRIVKCIISAVFWIAYEIRRTLERASGRPVAPVTTVLYYHRIRTDERRRFARQLDHLCRWTTAVPAQMTEAPRSGVRYTAVTFDDGWASFADIAMPELEQRNIPVTLFAIPGRLGEKLDYLIDEPLLTGEQLTQLSAKGVTIGSHSLTHRPLTEVDEAAALHELSESRIRLSRILKQDVDLFAFPFSWHNQRLLELCRLAGYRRAFTGTPYLAHPGTLEFETGRIRVDPSDWMIEFHLKLVGAYRWLPAAVALKRLVNMRIRRRYGLLRASLPSS